MDIPRYWARTCAYVPALDGDGTWRIPRWGWSATSQAEADARAEAARERTEERWRAHRPDFASSQYVEGDYAAQPAREEILHELHGATGDVVALVTRNSYGAQILNTDRLLMIDIDEPQSLFGRLKRLLFRQPNKRDDQMVAAVEDSGPERFRTYRTAAGWRLICVSRAMAGVDEDAVALMRRFPVDPYYLRLCQRQHTFRARLTPKPWRCSCLKPNFRYPYESEETLARSRQWISSYDQAAASFRTARLIGGGEHSVHRDLASLVRLHDELCQVEHELPLA